MAGAGNLLTGRKYRLQIDFVILKLKKCGVCLIDSNFVLGYLAALNYEEDNYPYKTVDGGKT